MQASARSVRPLRARPERGAVLIVALLIAAVIAISLTSYITLSRNSLKLASRTFYNSAAINLAETGVEEALWAFNQVTSGVALGTAWSGWTISGAAAKRTFTDFTLGDNVTVAVRVLVDQYNPGAGVQPRVYSEATVTMPTESRTVSKAVEVQLRRRSRFAMGLVARNQINFNGNVAKVDSWNSLYNDDGTPRGSPVDYDIAYRKSNGSVGSTSVAVGSVAIDNADIYGFASVGGSSSGIRVGSNGIISGNFSATPGTVDTTRIATDFTANFDAVSNPSGATVIGAVGATLGTTGVTSVFSFGGVITSSLTVRGNVTLILTGTGSVLRLNGGGDTLTLDTGATLTIYTAGDIDLTGGGVVNPSSQASTLQIYGTAASAQNIAIGGGAEFTGVIYAPNAHVKIHGTPDVMGSIVGNEITVVGNAKFHYDEALSNFGGNNPFGIVRWLELTTSAARAAAFASW